ncbi:MAG: carboxylesterase/lipase family protein [Rhizobium sp.]|nr:carboxylesterase/lipase family protein [Rhizobium sp.]
MSNNETDAGLVVEIDSGAVRGVVADGVRSWRGMPFAAPPVGPLRFRAPQPVTPWQGIRAADEFGPIPMQKRGFEPIGGAGETTPVSEDCLTINVAAPLTPDSRPRPVVVWIYGGGFSLGGSRAPLYRGDRLVKTGDVIFVSFNHRVGVFGFSDFRAWSTDEAPIDANLGLRDQVAALEWVRRNISAFGGDPEQVTIAGQSAGAMSVVSLMCMPSAAGLFHRAFAMSACGGTAFGPERHHEWAAEILKILGLDPQDKVSVSAALKTLPAEAIRDAASRFFYDMAPDAYPGRLPSSPVIDGDVLPIAPMEAFRTGKSHRIPLIIGTMDREGAMLAKALPVIPATPERLETLFRHSDPSVRARVAGAYPGYPSKRRAIDIGGDLVFWQPSVLIAEGHAGVAPCWAYRFDYATPLVRLVFGAATHGLDLPMFFGTTGEGDLGKLDLFRRRASAEMSRRFQGEFLRFVHGGEPGWPRYDAGHRRTRIFDHVDREESDPRSDRRLAWRDFVV